MLISMGNTVSFNKRHSFSSVDLSKNKNYNLFGVKSTLSADRFEKCSINFRGKMEKESYIEQIANEFAVFDFKSIAEDLVKYGQSNTGAMLVDFSNKDNSQPIHVCYLASSNDTDFTHFYCSKEDFIGILRKTRGIVADESPEYLKDLDDSIEKVSKKLELEELEV